MSILRSFRTAAIALVVMTALPCFSAEVAVLKNGFSIRHERREVVGDVTRLYVNADGSSFVDIPTASIEHYEAAPDSPTANAVQPAKLSRPSAGAVGASPRLKVDLHEVVNSASQRYRLDPDLVNSVIKAESGFNVRAVSPKGAQGLMQLMPGTATQLGVPNSFDPEANVDGGTKYLRELLERYDFDLVKALAAYNAGPQRVEQFGGVPPYYETRAYVARIVRDFNKKKAEQKKTTSATASRAKKTTSKTAASSAQKGPAGPVVQARASANQPSE